MNCLNKQETIRITQDGFCLFMTFNELEKYEHDYDELLFSGFKKNKSFSFSFPNTLIGLQINNCKFKEFPFLLPSTLIKMFLSNLNIPHFPDIEHLLNLQDLHIRECDKLEKISRLPPNLKTLRIFDNPKLKSIPELPSKLEVFDIGKNKNLKIKKLKLPNSLLYFFCYDMNLPTICSLPRKLIELNIRNKKSRIEIYFHFNSTKTCDNSIIIERIEYN